jgi:hypothetical protein
MIIKINPVVRPFIFILLILYVTINYAKSQQPKLKQVMPRSEWMDYRPEETHRAVILDGEGGVIVASVALVPDKLNSVLFWQKIENPHWGRAGRNRQFSIVNTQLKTSIIKTLNLKFLF